MKQLLTLLFLFAFAVACEGSGTLTIGADDGGGKDQRAVAAITGAAIVEFSFRATGPDGVGRHASQVDDLGGSRSVAAGIVAGHVFHPKLDLIAP